MSKQRYPEEFKTEAVKQITERGHKVADVSARLGVSQHSLYQWINAYRAPVGDRQAQLSQTDELRRLKTELKRVTEERDILKKGRSVLCQAVRVKYAFIEYHEHEHGVRRMYKVMAVCPSSYYAWKYAPVSFRGKHDQRLLGLLKHRTRLAGLPARSQPSARNMNRCGNCHDNAVAESFFQFLKRERTRRQIYPSHDQARTAEDHHAEQTIKPCDRTR